MLQFDGEAMRLVAVVCIVCSQVIGINSKTSILWKLNRNSGQIDGFNEDSNQHVSVAMENFLLCYVYRNVCVCLLVFARGAFLILSLSLVKYARASSCY